MSRCRRARGNSIRLDVRHQGDKDMRMTIAFICLLLSSSALADRVIAVEGKIRAAALANDGNGVVIADNGHSGSTVIFFDERGETRLSSALTIKSAVRRIGRRSIFALVAGEENSSRYVLFDQRGEALEPVWDSARLPLGAHRVQYAVPSDDGSLWAVTATSKTGTQIVIGELPSYDFRTRISVTTLKLSDTPTLTWIRADSKEPVVVLNTGTSIHLYGNRFSKTLDVAPVATVSATPGSGLVWVKSRGKWTAFDAATGERRTAALPRSVADRSPWSSPDGVWIAEPANGALHVRRRR